MKYDYQVDYCSECRNVPLVNVNLFGIFGLQTFRLLHCRTGRGGAKKLSRHSNPWLLHPGDLSHLVPFFLARKTKHTHTIFVIISSPEIKQQRVFIKMSSCSTTTKQQLSG